MINNKHNVSFFYMEKSFLSGDESISVVRDDPSTHSYIKENFFSILKKLNQNNFHTQLFIFTKKIDNSSDQIKIFKHDNIDIIYTSDFLHILNYLKDIDTLILRGNYSRWDDILCHYNNNLISLPCWSGINAKTLKIKRYNKDKFVIFVDEQNLIESFLKNGIHCEVFKKPAPELFYKNIVTSNSNKTIDILFICNKSDRPWKRADLFFECIESLDSTLQKPINVTVAGDFSTHFQKIQILNSSLKNIHINSSNKRYSKKEIRKFLDESKISVCFSDRDANPRTISESLARNVPVLCASDLLCGKFQINEKTGMFFEPNKENFVESFNKMLINLDKFEANKYCIKLSDAVNQIIKYCK